MKKIVLVLFCLSLTTVFTLAADYHLIQTQLLDDKSSFPVVWVMVEPDGQKALVFEKLNSQMMENWLKNLPPDSVLLVRRSRHASVPDWSEQWKAFKAFCEIHKITLITYQSSG